MAVRPDEKGVTQEHVLPWQTGISVVTLEV